jgi:tetratricopeptide (TPR) repeat protein
MTEREALAALRGSDPAAAARAEAALWAMWCRAGTPEVDALFAEGVKAMEERRFPDAEASFTRIIDRAPDFAEGWNKRATVRYLARDFEGSIADCRETVARKPHHFGALSGQGLCHVALGQFREAADLFRRALQVHPNLESVRQNLRLALGEAVRGNGRASPD